MSGRRRHKQHITVRNDRVDLSILVGVGHVDVHARQRAAPYLCEVQGNGFVSERTTQFAETSLRRAAGELWRSQFETERNLIIINSGHRDFVYSSRTKALKLRYICRLYAKELVLKNLWTLWLSGTLFNRFS